MTLFESKLRRPRRPIRLLAIATLPVAAAVALIGSPVHFGSLIFGGDAEAVTKAQAALPRALPAELAALTGNDAEQEAVEGEAAQQINAGLPFSSAPLEAASPFRLTSASTNDGQRALRCLTQAIYYEAAYEPVEGRRAVAQVVLNRMRHPAYPNSVCGVVYDGSTRPGCQFSFTCDGSLRRTPVAAPWAAAERLAREALAGSVASSVGMATHYHADYVAPYWAPRLAKLKQIGTHIFYRWPGGWGRPGAFTSRYAGHEGFYEGRVYAPGSEVLEVASGLLGLPPDPTDRHAPNDIGGRLDTTKGTFRLPDPRETASHYDAARERQAVNDPAAPVALAAGASGDQ